MERTRLEEENGKEVEYVYPDDDFPEADIDPFEVGPA